MSGTRNTKKRRMKERTQGERRLEKDKGLVHDVSWRARNRQKKKEKTGMSEVAGKRMRFTERQNKGGDVGERQERD